MTQKIIETVLLFLFAAVVFCLLVVGLIQVELNMTWQIVFSSIYWLGALGLVIFMWKE